MLAAGELELDPAKLQPLLITRLDAIETQHKLPDPDQESLRQILIAQDSPVKIAPDRYSVARLFTEEGKKEFEKEGKLVVELAGHPGAPVRAMSFVDADKMYDGNVFIRGNPATPDRRLHGSSSPRCNTSHRHLFPKTRAAGSNSPKQSRA